MRNILAVCAKEWRVFFSSATVLGVCAGFWLMAGVFFFDRVRRYNELLFRTETRLVFPDFAGALPPELNIHEQLLTPFSLQVILLLTVFIPVVTMRMFAEEKRTGTLPLLFTTKVSVGQLAVGKFLACWLLFTLMVMLVTGFLAALVWKAALATGPVLTLFVGLLCVAAVVAALGLWCSSLTNRQSVALLLTYVGATVWYDFSWAYNFLSSSSAQLLQRLALSSHMEHFARGALSGPDLIYYVGATTIFLLLTAASLLVSRAG